VREQSAHPSTQPSPHALKPRPSFVRITISPHHSLPLPHLFLFPAELDPLPNALKTAYAAAKEGKVPGSLSWSLALALPGATKPVIISGLGLSAEGLPVVGTRRRELLTASECKELLVS
jgi:hypothetical protein